MRRFQENGIKKVRADAKGARESTLSFVGMWFRLPVAALLFCAAVSAQSFAELRELYAYDRTAPLDVRLSSKGNRNNYTLYDISYSLAEKQRADGYLAVPQGRGRKPAVVWMHSSGALAWLGDAVLLAQCGAVSLVVNVPGAGVSGASGEGDRDTMIMAVVALRRAVDVLEARDDVDANRIAVVGHSFGAMMSAVAASIDPRFKAAVFEAGLLGMSIHIGTSLHPWAQGVRKQLGAQLAHYLEVISVVDAAHYIGDAPTIPKLFQSAWYDPGVPHDDASKFYEAATGPKELKWYDTAHDIDDIAAIADRARFLAKALDLGDAEKTIRSKAGIGAKR
jgi:cephalosporin-C deacetylase-like acetyl esterase